MAIPAETEPVVEAVFSCCRDGATAGTVGLYGPDRHQVGARQRELPLVMTREEVKAVLSRLKGEHWLMAALMYGTGIRLMECLRLRVKDIDFDSNQITIREARATRIELQCCRKLYESLWWIIWNV